MGGGGDGLSGCAQRHIELSDALAACIAAGKACDGVTRMPFVEMKHGLRCPGGAYHRLGKLPMAPYMGRMNAAQTWILLRGAEAKACDRIHSLRIATARPPPSPPLPPPPPPPQPPPPSSPPPPSPPPPALLPHAPPDTLLVGNAGAQTLLRGPSEAPQRPQVTPALPVVASVQASRAAAIAAPAAAAAAAPDVVPLPSGWEPPLLVQRGSLFEAEALARKHAREATLASLAAADQPAGALSALAAGPSPTRPQSELPRKGAVRTDAGGGPAAAQAAPSPSKSTGNESHISVQRSNQTTAGSRGSI